MCPPTYEYECKKCEHRGEYYTTISKMDEDLPKICEVCKTEGETKRIFPTSNDGGVIFKGTGWFNKGGY